MTTALTTRDITQMNESEALIEIRNNPEKYPHFYSFSEKDKLTRLQAIMAKCYQARHIKDLSFIGPDSVDLMEQIDKDRRFCDMSFEEIKTAFKNGAFERYGECYGLTVAFFIKCLNSYIEENRQNYIEAEKQKEMKAKREYEAMMLKNTRLKLEASKRRAAIERAAKEMLYNNKI